MTHPAPSAAVEVLLLELDTDAERMRRLLFEVVVPAGSRMFPLDFLAIAAVKRHVSTTSACVAMIRAWNMGIARSLLRMHIDTSLRFSAAWHVKEPHQFARAVIKGERLNKLKSLTGERLTDSHLVQLHKAKHSWLPAVYEQLSGYVHFSGAHIADAIEDVRDESDTIQFLISNQDLNFPESSWVEVLECFREATSILRTFLEAWGDTKNLSDAQLEALRSSVNLIAQPMVGPTPR